MSGRPYSDKAKERWDTLEREMKDGQRGESEKQILEGLRTEHNAMREFLAWYAWAPYEGHASMSGGGSNWRD